VIDLSTSSSSQAVTLSFRVAPHHASQDVWVVTVRDLTRERDRAQMLLNDLDAVRAQRDHWESTARATAHDVRSSLAAMTGFIKLALGPSGGFSPEAVAHLERALEAASRIRSMTERVLHGEKAEIGPAECVHIPPLGQRLFHSLRAAHPDVPFTWCVEAGDEFAAMRSDTLWEVLWNLLSNSVAYRSPARTLHLELRAWRAGTEVWIEVRDNGRGLARGEEEAIFLYRRRGSFSEGTEGSGLGLFSARRLIESCGGRVWATPTADGATFVVAAPAWVT
jgi:signal transduction histidine kinase